MARSRTAQSTPTDEPRRVNMAFDVVSDEELEGILSGAKSRGRYRTILADFISSGVKAWRVPTAEGSGEFAGKKTQSLKTGFESAKKHKEAPDGSDQVRVIVQNDAVFIVNDAAVQAA